MSMFTNVRSARAPFPWLGGKANPKIKAFILANLPPHTRYIEPFGGGASILLSKQPAEVEVYNDVNRGIVNFFRVLCDKYYFADFMAKVSLLPVSRELYDEYLRTWTGIHDPVEQAVRWYYIARTSFGGMFGAALGTAVNSTGRGMSEVTSNWRSSFENLPLVHDRMQRVQIECCDWRDALARYSGPGWLAYCDPPYAPGTRKAGGYEHELRDSDHADLVQALLQYKGAVVLSGYNTPLYAPLEAAGRRRLELETMCSASGHTRLNGLQGTGSSSHRQRRVECLWIRS